MTVQADGTVTLAVTRVESQWSTNVIADADGEVHQASMSWNESEGCSVVYLWLYGRNVIQSVTPTAGITVEQPVELGLVGGDLDQLHPSVLGRFPNQYFYQTWSIGQNLYFVTGANPQIFSWPDGRVVDTPGVYEHYSDFVMRNFTFQGDTLFWYAISSLYNHLRMRTASGEILDFVNYGADWTRGASDLGTDGVDYVWDEGHRIEPTARFEQLDVMTAKYTTDPSSLQKRRLRSESGNFGDAPFLVGCGYAAHLITLYNAEGFPQVAVRVLRIADGVSWVIEGSAELGWISDAVWAVTCDEVFFGTYTNEGGNELARVRIDSLGPGTPPD